MMRQPKPDTRRHILANTTAGVQCVRCGWVSGQPEGGCK